MMRWIVKLWNKSFKTQLVLGVGLILTALISGFSYLTIKKEKDFLEAEALNQIKNRSLALAVSSKTWLVSNDYAGLEEVLNSFSIYEDIISAAIIDMEGKVIVHTDPSLVGKYISDQRRIDYLNRAHLQKGDHFRDEEILSKNKRYIDMIRMIHYEGMHIGMVYLRLDNMNRQKRIDESIFQELVFSVISILVAFLVLYMIVNSFTRGLSGIMATMQGLKQGDKTVRAKEEGVKELYALACEFNRALDALRQSEASEQKIKEQYEYAIKGTRDGLWDWDIRTNTLYFSPRWKEMLGYAEDELPNIYETWESRIHPDDIEQAKRDVASSHERPGKFFENVNRMLHKDGHWVWILTRGQTIFDVEGRPIRMIGFHTDITDLKLLENELKEKDELIILQSRYSAIGETIGMIAHQWRQPLSVIAMDANTILVGLELDTLTDESLRSVSEQILEQTRHLSNTISDFRNFFAPEREKENVAISDVLSETKNILAASLYTDEVSLNIDDRSKSAVCVYKRELIHVLINLINNARDALASRSPGEKKIRITASETDKNIVITICDNAGGIEASIMDRIFDPYFTTKAELNGTGLGLYMSKTIVTKHLGGSISVKNDDEGACFTIRLPKQQADDL